MNPSSTRRAASLVIGVVLSAHSGSAATTISIDSGLLTNGFMNVYEIPGNGGAYVFGSGWGISDLSVTFPTPTSLVFTPNSIGDPNPFWYTPSGGPGAVGNKVMEASLYGQADGPLAGQTVTFQGTVTGFSLSPTLGHTFLAFVRDFAPDYSSVVEQTVPITGTGNFAVTLATLNDPNRHVWYGLQMKGVDVWSTDLATAGSVQVSALSSTPVPEASSGAVIGAGLAGLLAIRLRRKA